MCRNHYESIRNYIDLSKYKNKVIRILCNTKFDSGMRVSVAEVAYAIKNLKKRKSSRLEGLTAEGIVYSSQRLHILLYLGFNSMLTHGYTPKYMIDSVREHSLWRERSIQSFAIRCVLSRSLRCCNVR